MKLIPATTSIAVTPLDNASGKSRFRKALSLFGRGDGDVARVAIFAALVVVLGIISPSFFSQASWLATSQSATVIVLLAIGQSFVIITGGIDLSVGAVLGASSMVSAAVMRNLLIADVSSWTVVGVGLLVSLAVGLLAGLINGLVITKLKITPFIATLGMLGVASGTTNLINNGTEIVTVPSELGIIGNTTLLGGWLAVPVAVTIAVALIAAVILSRTRFGMRTFAIGSNSAAARRAGIGVDRHLISVYMIAGLTAGIAGFLLMSRFVSASPLAGSSLELAAIAAAVIGGASLVGGRGSILGTVIGASITATLQIGLILAGVASFWQTVTIGVIIVIAVYGDQLRIRMSNK